MVKYEPREHVIDAELANGNLDAWKQALGFPRATPRPHRRTLLLAGECAYCDANRNDEMMPPHDASPRCESGARSHCTCDTCF